MAHCCGNVSVKFDNIRFTIDEEELRALDALVGYGDDAFLEVFKEKLGAYYSRDHEAGLRRFFQSIRDIASSQIALIDQTRRDIKTMQDSHK